MSVTVGTLRERLKGVDDTAPVNLVVRDPQLERMVAQFGSMYVLKIDRFGSFGGNAGSNFFVSVSLVYWVRENTAYGVWSLNRTLEGLHDDAAVLVRTDACVSMMTMLGGARLRVVDAYPYVTERRAKEFTFELGLEA
jgi:hypothetical protein